MTMLGTLTDWQVQQLIDTIMAGNAFASLHVSNPLLTDPTATEVPGGSYARAQVYWEQPSTRVIHNQNALRWEKLPSCSVTHIGVFTGPAGGDFRLSVPLGDPLTILQGGSYAFPKNELVIAW